MNAHSKRAVAMTTANDVAERVEALDWEHAARALDAGGCATIDGLFRPRFYCRSRAVISMAACIGSICATA